MQSEGQGKQVPLLFQKAIKHLSHVFVSEQSKQFDGHWIAFAGWTKAFLFVQVPFKRDKPEWQPRQMVSVKHAEQNWGHIAQLPRIRE